VSIGKDKILGIERAIKRINKSLIDTQDGTVDIMNEFNLLKELDHPNVMKIYEAYEDQLYIYLVTELLKGGEIFEKLIEKKQFSENRCALIMKQILQGLAYCHEKKIVHRYKCFQRY
jgi:calcium-dependent protein kinase